MDKRVLTIALGFAAWPVGKTKYPIWEIVKKTGELPFAAIKPLLSVIVSVSVASGEFILAMDHIKESAHTLKEAVHEADYSESNKAALEKFASKRAKADIFSATMKLINHVIYDIPELLGVTFGVHAAVATFPTLAGALLLEEARLLAAIRLKAMAY